MVGKRRHAKPIVGVIVACIILAVGAWIFFPRPENTYGRETYVLVSDPMIVLSWSTVDQTLTMISFPSGFSAEGTHGYGTYSLAAFWRLGEIDKKDGTVLAETISEVLGIPVDGYIGPKTGIIRYHDSMLATVKDVMSVKNIFGILGGQFRTNIPMRKFTGLVWLLNYSRIDHINVYNFTQDTERVAQDVVLPDGSTEQLLDPERLDAQLAAVFENMSARSESVTVAVYNTTSMPSLGNRAGRLLTNLGVSIVTVGNDTPEINTCTVTGNDAVLKSDSAKIIIQVFGCKSVVGDTTRADLILRIGKSYAKRFLPN